MIRSITCLAASIALISVGFLGAEAAAAVVVDPDAFPDGTVINNSFAGVTLTAMGSVSGPNVLSLNSGLASTGVRVFGFVDDYPVANSVLWGDGTIEELRADFAAGATSVSLDFIADDSSDENAELKAFNASDVLVASAFTPLNVSQPQGVPVTLTVSDPHIAYIRATWDGINESDNGALDNLVYTPVPEPATLIIWSLLGAGGVGVSVWRRRRSGQWIDGDVLRAPWPEENRQAIRQVIARGGLR